MTRCFLCVAVLASVSLTVVAGCDFGSRRIRPPSVNAATAAQAAMKEYDADGDGKIIGAELDKCPALKSVAKAGDRKGIDPKGEGITAENLQAAIGQWQIRGVGRLTYSCMVLKNGQQLQKATVKFVPEKFLGADYPVAIGTTNKEGAVAMSVPNVSPEGVAVGFYRVEITKDGENIPAQYNTETTLGVGIIRSQPDGSIEVFNLKY